MFNISLYLERFQSIKDPSIFKREIIEALTEATGHKIEEKEINYRKGVVTIEAHSLLRSEIFQRRGELIEKLSPLFLITEIR